MRADLWANLPKLAELPPLEDTLAALDAVAEFYPDRYPEFWYEALVQVGSSASVRYDEDGERSAMIGFP